MVVNQPHYLLFCDTHLSSPQACALESRGFGRWHFVLEQLDGPERIEAADSESEVHRDRLALLAVVRGLEALEQPSQVTLITTSRYVSRGLRYGLNEWREADYTWEHFGMQKPIRNADLWQRIDRAMQYHLVTCRLLQSPLAQAVVETAAELDEITCLTQPLGNEVCSVQLAPGTAAPQEALAEPQRSPHQSLPGGTLRRFDTAHTSEPRLSKRPRSARANVLVESRGELTDETSCLATATDLSSSVQRSADARWHEAPDTFGDAVPDGGCEQYRDALPSDSEYVECRPCDGGRTDRAGMTPRRWTIRIPIPILRGRWWPAAPKWWSVLRSKFRGRSASPMMAPT